MGTTRISVDIREILTVHAMSSPVMPKRVGASGSKLMTMAVQCSSKLVAGDTQGR